MAARHMKKYAKGGKIENAGGNPSVEKEAEEKKNGGKVKKKHEIGAMHGGAAAKRLDRRGRKSGGRVGADRSPLSSAHSAASADAEPKSNG